MRRRRINDVLEGIFTGMGLKAARQNYTYVSSGRTYAGQNAYAILQAPRGDATEALVLVAAWRDVDGRPNRTGVALLLTLARYFRRWSLWSKDIVFLVPPDSRAGPQAWVDAYHDSHDRVRVASLPLKSGALQGAVAIDYARQVREDEAGDVGTWASTHFASVHVVYDGVNGQLPNLDLVNSIVNIAGGQMGMGSAIQGMYAIPDGRSVFEDRLRTMARGMLNQGLGQATGPHSCFIPYHVDAVTIQPFGEGGWHDEMGMGRLVEGTFRSLNNLLEHLHQSFFFYLLMGRDRFVSIGTYLPAAMLVAANFTVMAIALWVRSGHVDDEPATAVSGDEKSSRNAGREKPSTERPAGETAPRLVERDLFLPIGVVAAAHFLGVLPLYLFNHLQASVSTIPNTSIHTRRYVEDDMSKTTCLKTTRLETTYLKTIRADDVPFRCSLQPSWPSPSSALPSPWHSRRS